MKQEFTENDISPDEEILWTEKQSYASMLGSIAMGFILAPFGIGLVLLFSTYIQLQSTVYAITDKALYKKDGIYSESITRVPLNKIQNTEYSRSWAEKQFDHGTVEISTAGSSGSQLRFKAVPEPKFVQEKINELSKNVSSTVKSDSDTPQYTELASELRKTRENIEDIIKYMNK